MQQHEEKQSTPQEKKLFEALIKKGVNAQLQYPDGHKTVDIAILDSHLYIEVDGIKHFINPKQIKSDFKRSHFSDGDDFSTFYVTNQIIMNDKYFDKVVDALVEVINERSTKQPSY
jgi:very-short-patch-repair endonuclease